MASKTIVASRYLPAEAIHWVVTTSTNHPVAAASSVLLLFVSIMAFLKHRFGRGGSDIFVAALLFTALIIFIGACLSTFLTQPGYRVYHPLF